MALPIITAIVRCVSDPELRFTPGGSAVASFRAVASKSRKNEADEWETINEIWFTVTAWNALAEFVAEHVENRQEVNLSGEIFEEEYETRDGEKRKALKVTARGIDPIKRREQSGGRSQSSNRPAQQQQSSHPDPWGPPAGQTEEPPF